MFPFLPVMIPLSLLPEIVFWFHLLPFHAPQKEPLQAPSSSRPLRSISGVTEPSLLMYKNHFQAHYIQSPYVTSVLPKEFLFTQLMLSVSVRSALNSTIDTT